MHPLHVGFTPDFDQGRYLYHYTSMDKAIAFILHTGTLRFNSFANVNDPMESDLSYWSFSNDENSNGHEAIRDQLYDWFRNRAKVVCFSRDDQGDWGSPEFSPLDFCARGHSKPRMWATYGDGHAGVCMVFDKELLTQAFKSGLKANNRIFQRAVRYGKLLPNDENEVARFDVRAFVKDFQTAFQQKIEEHLSTFFFYKHVDWSTEDEYRFVIIGDERGPMELAFDDALIGVVVGTRSKPGYVRIIGDITQNMGVPCRYLDWGWRGASYVSVNEAAKKLGPRYNREG